LIYGIKLWYLASRVRTRVCDPELRRKTEREERF
jgi:hypothetical protein